MIPEFQPWPKIARLNRRIVITEKIDGTNAAVGVIPCGMPRCRGLHSDPTPVVYAQSRSRIIAPQQDNFGFAKWVADNAAALARDLGEGLHFGEWWGSGIQRGYGLADKRFSLFNTSRWTPQVDHEPFETPGLDVVPVLYDGPFSALAIEHSLDRLRADGSHAAPGFNNPEGIVIFHEAAQTMFKVTLQGDEQPKGQSRE